MKKEFIKSIETIVGGTATIEGNRIFVEFSGIKNATALKQFMKNNGFDYVFGAFNDGVYKLGFSNGEL